MPNKWMEGLFWLDVAVAVTVLLIVVIGGVIGGWITLLREFGAL